MMRHLPVFTAFLTLFFFMAACNKGHENGKYEDWSVHDYCVPKYASVQCSQDDYSTVTLCCDETNKYHEGQKLILTDNTTITYFRQYIKLLKKY